MVFIDNKETVGFMHLENLIPINDFNGDMKDNVIDSLEEYLMSFKYEKDVRAKIVKDF